ncbi:MAG TPA: response regulator [Pyrinomonadaceae bacterium]|jgi:CheY-like chemotaxis protein
MAAISNFNRRQESVGTNLHAPAQKKYFDGRVLIVEDHDDTRLMLRTMLEWRGVSVVEAADGEAAVSMAETCRPDLIFMDGSLPSLDGLTATRRIRQLDGTREVPIIFISGHAMSTAQAAAFDAGCDGYLVKPIDFAEWNRVLERYLPQRAQH